jgi:hypothetical protein
VYGRGRDDDRPVADRGQVSGDPVGTHFSATRNWITIPSMSSGVRVGWRSGREVRSSRPASPWASYRLYHLGSGATDAAFVGNVGEWASGVDAFARLPGR